MPSRSSLSAGPTSNWVGLIEGAGAVAATEFVVMEVLAGTRDGARAITKPCMGGSVTLGSVGVEKLAVPEARAVDLGELGLLAHVGPLGVDHLDLVVDDLACV